MPDQPDEMPPLLAKLLQRIVSDNQKHRLEYSETMAGLMRQLTERRDESETDGQSRPVDDSTSENGIT